MNSEKVKEIKEWLENESEVYRNEVCYNASIYINELESENEILQGTKNRLTFADRIELVNNAVETKLKQFAERLKEEFIKSANIQDSITAKKLFRDICPVKVDKVLKKTLKEFIGE